MTRRLQILIGAVIGLVAALSAFTGHSSIVPVIGSVVAPQSVFADHNGPWLPGDPMNYPAQARVASRGYVTYCVDGVSAAYPRFRDQIRNVADYAAAHGMPPAVEVAWRVDCDIGYQAPSHSGFVSLCGDGAYGCIYYWRDSVDIYIDLQGGHGYTYNDSTICHEGIDTGHFMFLHEEYNDRAFTSNHRDWTCMDFGVVQPGDPLGRNVWALPDWDRDRIFNAFVPDAPSSVTLTVANGWATVKWSQDRADGGRAHVNGIAANTSATTMMFGHSACDGCAIDWLPPICGAKYAYCATPYKDGSRSFDSYWRGCLYVRSWNNAFGYTPQVSAPDFYTKAGCW